jgi:hypothetical protein
VTGRTPEGFEVDACRSCTAPIIWATTKHDRLMPVGAAPTEKGNVELAPGSLGRGVVATVLTGPSLLGGPLYTAHFANCPEADAWRDGGRHG